MKTDLEIQQQTAIIKYCNALVLSNKGITMEEKYKLQKLPRIVLRKYRGLSTRDFVSLAKTTIQKELGRKNITPRDMKKEIINLLKL